MATYVQGASFSNNTGGTTSATSSFNATSGNNILVIVRWEGGDTTASCADTAGNTYTQIGGSTFQCGSSDAYVSAFYSLNITGNASNVVTITHGASRTYRRVTAVEYSGTITYSNYETASGSNASPTGAGLSASGAGLLFSGVGTYSFETATLAGDLANFRNFGAGEDVFHDGDYIVPGSATVTGAFSLGTTAQWRIINALFADSGSTNITESVPNGALRLTGIAPSVSVVGDVTESIPSGSLTLTGFAPSTSITGHVRKSIPSTTLTLTGVAPLATTTGARESIPAGSLTLTGFAPVTSITGHVRESISSSSLVLTGYAPTVRQYGNINEPVSRGTLRLVSYAPTIRNTGVVVSTRPVGGMSKRVRQKQYKQVMIDGKVHSIQSPDEEFFLLQAYLDKIRNQQILDLQKKKTPIVKKKIKLNASKIKRTETRIDKVSEEIKWRQKLQQEDDEILMLLAL